MKNHPSDSPLTESKFAPDSSAPTPQLLDAEQLGRFLHLGSETPGSARAALNLRIARGHPMPPCVRIPGGKERLWRPETVSAWLAEQEMAINPVRRRRGRPTKAQSILNASR